MKILFAEDEEDLQDVVAEYLRYQGYNVTAVSNGAEAVEKAASDAYDALVLDVMMPVMDGITAIKKIREMGNTIPAIFLTAKSQVGDRIEGLDAGADDYLTKPFSMEELGARVAAHLRREHRRRESAKVRLDNQLAIDYTERGLYYDGRPIPLAKKEFDIVELLSRHIGQVFGKERIYELIWSFDSDGDASVVAEHIRRIRAKFSNADMPDYIETVWSVGYKWKK